MARLRPTAAGFDGADSLERLQLAAAVSEALHMHESGVADALLAWPGLDAWCRVATRSLQRFDAAITVRTSGSTGIAKSCTHRLEALGQEVEGLVAILPGVTRIVSAVPCHHIYGFIFTLLLPARLGVPVLDLRGHAPGALATLARPGDLVVGYPEFWAAATRAAASGWPPGMLGVTSTAPCPAVVAMAAMQAGLSRLLQVHGASETAGIGWRDNPSAPYTLMAQWERAPRARLRRLGGTATIRAPDAMTWLDARHYHLAGRRDGAVQVGGVNVFPARVREVLQGHDDVADVAVRLMRPAEGARLKAYIVPRDPAADMAALQTRLTALAADRLAVAERPRAYSFGPRLPATAMGKPADWPITPPSADWPITPPSPVPPAG